MTGRRRWWLRLGGGLAGFAAIEASALLLHGRADELRLAFVVALVVCAAGLLVDAGGAEPATWTLHPERESGLGRLDPRTAAYLRIVETHLSSRGSDVTLGARLRELADQTLRVRHDLTVNDPRAAQVLGPELDGVVNNPALRLDLPGIDRCVQRIEDL